jgi:type II secretory pathway pseudopilin PulG
LKLKVKSKKEIRAFTLMEVLLYISLVSIMLTVLVSFIGAITSSRQRSQVIADVNEQGVQVMQQITQTIRNSTLINNPPLGTPGSTVSVNVPTASLSPTIFSLSSGVIEIKEGSATAIPLTSNRVVVSNLIFTNLSRSGTKGVIKIQFTLTHTNPNNRKEFSYSETFYGAASLK